MAKHTVLIVGATGDVGQGIVRAVLARGWTAVAAGRSEARLAERFAGEAGPGLILCEGSLDTEQFAAALWDKAQSLAVVIDTVVISVNEPIRIAPLADWTGEAFSDLLIANVATHFNAAKAILPRMPEHGLYIGIGGGMADLVIPKMGPISVAQAGLRMMYRSFARERKGGADLRELMVVSLVNGASNREIARPEWVTDDDIGRHVCAIVEAPEQFPGPVLQLRSREQAGQPDTIEETSAS